MGQWQDFSMVYTCDNCGKEVALDSAVGGPLGGPTNWKSVTPQTTSDGDWFCGYSCLSQWAANMAAKVSARIEARAARAENKEEVSNGSS